MSEAHPLNAYVPITARVLGNETDLIALQLPNAEFPISVSPSGSAIESSALQLLKAA